MITGRLTPKRGKHQAIINLKHGDGRPWPKWVSTDLLLKGNAKRAEQRLQRILSFCNFYHIYNKQDGVYIQSQSHELIVKALGDKTLVTLLLESDEDVRDIFDGFAGRGCKTKKELEAEKVPEPDDPDNPLFSNYMREWLVQHKKNVRHNTHYMYGIYVNSRIAPYFDSVGVRLKDVDVGHLEDYYTFMKERFGNKVITVKKHHTAINLALKKAYKEGRIKGNPATLAELGKDETVFRPNYLKAQEVLDMLKVIKGEKLELVIMMAVFYGFRRSEILGLRWRSIDFTNDTIVVEHVMLDDHRGEKLVQQGLDNTKNNPSYRTMPIMPEVKAALMAQWNRQQEHKRRAGKSYNTQYYDYIFTDVLGNIIKPNYVSASFPDVLLRHDIRRVRFHDLRHTCASLLVQKEIPLIKVKEWLGHADITTTMKYAHLDVNSKIETAKMVSETLSPGVRIESVEGGLKANA